MRSKGLPPMNTQVKMGIATMTAVVSMVFGVVLRAEAAGAPQMVANELAAQRALGYSPCEPRVGQISAEDLQANPEVLAWAGGTLAGEDCSIEFASNVPADALGWIAWHEVCHLSTMNAIYADPHRSIVDSVHRHPLFLACISQGPAENGGYL